MAVKGTLAKEYVDSKLKEAFGEDYIGLKSGKIYVMAPDEGGIKIQVALSMTCPKAEIFAEEKSGGAFSLEDNSTVEMKEIKTEKVIKEVKPSGEETERIKKMLATLGL